MPQDYKLTSVTQAFDDADQYGNITWSVGWEGASDHALLKTRPDNEPKVGDVVFGELQPTKSGKAVWLKKKKRDDYPQHQSGGTVASGPSPQAAPQTNDRDARIEDQVIYKGAIEIYRCGELSVDECVARAVQIMDAVKARHNAPQPVAPEVEDNVPF
tara:strand:+ start:3588 stop:4061 length:474 start_codon:yes stop_codon:yes gene_type:complete